MDDRSHHLHPLFAFLLLLQELSFTGDVSSITLRRHVLPEGRDRGTGDDFTPDGPLDGDLEHLARNLFLQSLAGPQRTRPGLIAVDDL